MSLSLKNSDTRSAREQRKDRKTPELIQNKTVLIIAHRMRSVANAEENTREEVIIHIVF